MFLMRFDATHLRLARFFRDFTAKQAMLFLMVCAILCPAAQADPVTGFRLLIPDKTEQAKHYELPDLAGKSWQIPQAGQLTIVNFWATFCAPCRQEMPALDRLWQRYRDKGLSVVAIALDGDRKNAVEKFALRYNLQLPILLDNETDISSDYAVSLLPLTYLIAKDGRILGRVRGERDWDSETAHQLVEGYLSDAGAEGIGIIHP
jgi:thiol-disulfide isomerase/thioredoxin